MVDQEKAGHRERLRRRFLNGEEASRSQEHLLELLLTYAIPQKDVRPLARKLLGEFGSLPAVLTASPEALSRFPDVKSSASTLLKLVEWIRAHYATGRQEKSRLAASEQRQQHLFEVPVTTPPPSAREGPVRPVAQAAPSRRGTGLFGKALLKEAIALLPTLPETESIEEVRQYIRAKLHFSADQTRHRNANYIVHRMFPFGRPDHVLRAFAKRFVGTVGLQEVCFYRFMKAEPIVEHAILKLLVPNLSAGRLSRRRIRDFLKDAHPGSRSILDCAKGIVDALVAGGVARADREGISFRYRDVPLQALAFVLHSEFPEPAMYDLAKLEANQTILAMLWNPSRLLPSLYELRNQGIISKISEIDSVRQFTTKWPLDRLVDNLVAGRTPK